MSNEQHVEAMRSSVAELVSMHELECIEYKGAGRAWPRLRRIKIKRVTGIVSYYAALHEIGHIVGKGRSARKLEREANAWAYAIEVAIVKPTRSVEHHIARALRSYLWAGRRPVGLRKSMIEPENDHIFWTLVNPYGMTPVERMRKTFDENGNEIVVPA